MSGRVAGSWLRQVCHTDESAEPAHFPSSLSAHTQTHTQKHAERRLHLELEPETETERECHAFSARRHRGGRGGEAGGPCAAAGHRPPGLGPHHVPVQTLGTTSGHLGSFPGRRWPRQTSEDVAMSTFLGTLALGLTPGSVHEWCLLRFPRNQAYLNQLCQVP